MRIDDGIIEEGEGVREVGLYQIIKTQLPLTPCHGKQNMKSLSIVFTLILSHFISGLNIKLRRIPCREHSLGLKSAHCTLNIESAGYNLIALVPSYT